MGPRQSMQLEGSGQRFSANRVALIQGQGDPNGGLEPHPAYLPARMPVRVH